MTTTPVDAFALRPGTPAFPVVISGPSGAGKTVLINRLLELEPGCVRSITATSREPRPGEVDGVHYHFKTDGAFRLALEAGEFLEWAQVHDHYYGTPRQPLEAHLAGGRCVILNIDVQGARQVKAARPDAVLIFLMPPSMAVLEKRLRDRKTDGPEEIARRLRNALGEMAQVDHYHYLVVNDDLDLAVGRVRHIIEAERGRIGRLA